jgi:hypothetical protein
MLRDSFLRSNRVNRSGTAKRWSNAMSVSLEVNNIESNWGFFRLNLRDFSVTTVKSFVDFEEQTKKCAQAKHDRFYIF